MHIVKFWLKNLLKRPFYKRLKFSYQNEPQIRKNVIFVHVPKAAGTSIHNSLFGRLAGFGHSTAERYLSIYGPLDYFSAFKFAFVRNPYDRFISSYEYLKQGGNNSNDSRFYEDYMKSYASFDDFVLNGFAKSSAIQKHIHFRKQSDFLYSGKKCLVDFVGRFENLEKDYIYIKSIVGSESDLKFVNKSNGRNSDQSYLQNEASKKIIADFYKLDFENFGYET